MTLLTDALIQLFLGLCAGIISAALGLGGGVVMVPAFQALLANMDPHTAKGTSLFIIIFVSSFNAWRMTRTWAARPWRLVAVLASGSILGGYTSAWFTAQLSDAAVILIFVALLGFLGIRTFFIKLQSVPEGQVQRRSALSVLIGFLAGLAGGATGTGGGLVMVPLALMAGIASNERVVALSNMVMVATSIAGSMAHLMATPVQEGAWVVGHVNLALVPLVFIGAQIAAPAGEALNRWLTLPRRKIAMGVMLLLLAAQLLWQLGRNS